MATTSTDTTAAPSASGALGARGGDAVQVAPAAADTRPRRDVTSLNALPHGVAARVVSVEGEGALALRLMEMGVVPGAPVRIIKAAPLGDPIEVRVHGYHLALRRSEAETILVTSDE
jgi:Fe2+ transport system protein FeoA